MKDLLVGHVLLRGHEPRPLQVGQVVITLHIAGAALWKTSSVARGVSTGTELCRIKVEKYLIRIIFKIVDPEVRTCLRKVG